MPLCDSDSSSNRTMSDTSNSRSVTLAAIAGVTLSVRRIRMKLYAKWFSPKDWSLWCRFLLFTAFAMSLRTRVRKAAFRMIADCPRIRAQGTAHLIARPLS
jgi:hypothetical protein